MKINVFFLFTLSFLCSCNIFSDKPSTEKMKVCLTNELSSKAIVVEFDQQDGLAREKDGVKYYEGYFNAEIKFITNYGFYHAGESYKIIKGTLLFMKTEKGWNCQQFNFKSSNFVKINEGEMSTNNINSANEENTQTQEAIKNFKQEPPLNYSNERNLNQGRFPEASLKLLTPSDLSNLSKEDLKIMRNEIYARHGRIFQTDEMREYFSRQSWYRPQYINVDDLLSSLEKSNVVFIKKYE